MSSAGFLCTTRWRLDRTGTTRCAYWVQKDTKRHKVPKKTQKHKNILPWPWKIVGRPDLADWKTKICLLYSSHNRRKVSGKLMPLPSFPTRSLNSRLFSLSSFCDYLRCGQDFQNLSDEPVDVVSSKRCAMMKRVTFDHVRLHNSLRRANKTL